jgi:hypothetical protein
MSHLPGRILVGLLGVLGMAAALGGCVSPGATGPSGGRPEADLAETSWGYFLDAVDQGDDPWAAGCHYKCAAADCSGSKEFWGGDWCVGDDLMEWSRAEPHPAQSDLQRYSCAEECRRRGASGGRCVQIQDACDGAHASSLCECD